VLQPLWGTTTETASRLRGRLELLLDFAKAQGWRTGENPARWKGHLENILPRRPKLAQSHYAAMPYRELPAFMRRLRGQESIATKALEFLILTAARLGEVLGATWSEMDFEGAVWIVPATRMKAGQEHRVPLAPAAVAILKHAAECQSSEIVFVGRSRSRPVSGSALRKLMSANVTIHGFRSSFRDWAGNETNFPRELAEQSLAHRTGDATELAYRRGDALEKRRALMTAWADFIVPNRPCQPSTFR
jgi:integrase